jgi:hypothetical protein
MITINITKAKNIAHDARRTARSAEFSPLDIKATIPLETTAAEAARQAAAEARQEAAEARQAAIEAEAAEAARQEAVEASPAAAEARSSGASSNSSRKQKQLLGSPAQHL